MWSIRHSGDKFTPTFPKAFATRSQDLSETYFPNGLYDIVYVPSFLNTGKLYGDNFLIAVEPIDVLNDLDYPEDIETLLRNWEHIENINCQNDNLNFDQNKME